MLNVVYVSDAKTDKHQRPHTYVPTQKDKIKYSSNVAACLHLHFICDHHLWCGFCCWTISIHTCVSLENLWWKRADIQVFDALFKCKYRKCISSNRDKWDFIWMNCCPTIDLHEIVAKLCKLDINTLKFFQNDEPVGVKLLVAAILILKDGMDGIFGLISQL